MAVRIFKAWLHPDWVFNLTSLGRDHARELRYANHMTATVSVPSSNPTRHRERPDDGANCVLSLLQVVQRRRLEHSLRSDDDDDDDDDVKGECSCQATRFRTMQFPDVFLFVLLVSTETLSLVSDGGASQKVFLDLLLEQTGTRMSDQQLKDETTTMIVAVRECSVSFQE